MSSIRVGIIGAGGIVESRHLPGLSKISGVEVVAVCNRSRESGERVAARWGIPEVMDDWRALAHRADLDAVFIGTWPYTHAEMSIECLDAGRHVFCQARMARTFDEARLMQAAARRHPELVAMLCPPPNGLLGDRFVRRLLTEGALGELREVFATGRFDSNADPNAPLHWRQDFELQGYNTLCLGMWIEVVHRWVGLHASLSAVVKTHTPIRRRAGSGEEVRVVVGESVSIGAELRSGAVATYLFSGVARFAPHNVIELYGTDGTLRYDMDTDEVLLGRAGDPAAVPTEIPEELRRPWQVEADFISAIRDGAVVEPSFSEGLAYMEFTEAVYRSAAAGARVELFGG